MTLAPDQMLSHYRLVEKNGEIGIRPPNLIHKAGKAAWPFFMEDPDERSETSR
jgi:hypothetical protein